LANNEAGGRQSSLRQTSGPLSELFPFIQGEDERAHKEAKPDANESAFALGVARTRELDLVSNTA
jgi:hypothetical protein